MRHIDSEENRLFPEVRQSGIDMEQLALEMQAFESTMMGLHARPAARRGATGTATGTRA